MRLLILGLDEGFKRSGIGYTDTIILISVSFLKRKFVMLSIPRDLWIPVSDQEENRIGAVYRISEIKEAGKGPGIMTALVDKLFQVPVQYYVLVKMQGFIDIVDSLGGINITLSRPTASYPVGVTHLDGPAALAFARDRTKTDDFARMVQAQILIKGIIRKALKTETWSKLPQAFRGVTESNIPFWEWPRLVFMILHTSLRRIESYTITRDMVTPRIAPQGEHIIEPDWDKIKALTSMIFDK